MVIEFGHSNIYSVPFGSTLFSYEMTFLWRSKGHTFNEKRSEYKTNKTE